MSLQASNKQFADLHPSVNQASSALCWDTNDRTDVYLLKMKAMLYTLRDKSRLYKEVCAERSSSYDSIHMSNPLPLSHAHTHTQSQIWLEKSERRDTDTD